MKTTLKPLIYSFIFMCLCFKANAQSFSDTLRVSIAVNGLATNGDFGTQGNAPTGGTASSAYGYGAGISLQADIPLVEHINLTASAGYNNFFTTQYASNSQQAILGYTLPNFETIPLKLGIKWFIAKKLYIQGEAGETLLANKTALYAVYGNAFTYAPQVGLLMPLKNNHGLIDVGFRFESMGSFYNNDNKPNTFFGLHVAYAIKL